MHPQPLDIFRLLHIDPQGVNIGYRFVDDLPVVMIYQSVWPFIIFLNILGGQWWVRSTHHCSAGKQLTPATYLAIAVA